jgi:23S rRNA pseudouridine2605 synthase
MSPVGRLWAFHKPDGLITAERDPAGRPTIYNRAAQCAAARHAAPDAGGPPRHQHRGLLLLTNDGELKRAMEPPSSGVRTYRAAPSATSASRSSKS